MRGIAIGFASCKGGVGKTTLAANLGVYFSEKLGDKLILVDANLSAPNLAMHFGELNPKNTIHDVLAHQIPLEKAITKLQGINIVPGSLAYGKEIHPYDMCEYVERLKERASLVILDTAPGIGSEALAAMKVMEEVIAISNPDTPTVASTLKTFKAAEVCGSHMLGAVLNLVRGEPYELSDVEIKRILGWPILAKIPEDPKVREATAMGVPVIKYRPTSPSAKEFRRLGDLLWKELKKKIKI
ncbi:MAG: P-loop NTPase [Candidatus Hadarchaeales archaeon]